MSQFLRNAVLHIEDNADFRKSLAENLCLSSVICQAFGGKFIVKESSVLTELDHLGLEREVKNLYPSSEKSSLLIGIGSAQVAREYLNQFIPAVIISDTNFPMNGKKIAEYLQAHGFSDYALIGLSGTPIDEVPQPLKEWFATGNSRYFCKGNLDLNELKNQIIRNREDNLRRYGKTKG